MRHYSSQASYKYPHKSGSNKQLEEEFSNGVVFT